MAEYRTTDLARLAGIHPNTVRLYEKKGFFSPVPRADNGYRLFGERHVYQLRVCRCIFDYDWVGRDIRKASLKVIDAMSKWDLDKAFHLTQQYLELIENRITVAELTANILRRWVERKEPVPTEEAYTRRQASELIGVTPEVLRNWERNGLLTVPRIGVNKTRVYGNRELERLRIIYMLRQAKYSISAILRSLQRYDSGDTAGIVPALNTPEVLEEASWICVGDRWLDALHATADGAREIIILIKEARSKNM